ncbi:MAG: hypothetical protein AB7P49_00595 [Bdellovibrionales bacterium]
MNPATIVYEKSTAAEIGEAVYRVVDADIEILHEYTLMSLLLIVGIVFLLINIISKFIYYHTGAHGRFRAFILRPDAKIKK